jgi:hypothetical protein
LVGSSIVADDLIRLGQAIRCLHNSGVHPHIDRRGRADAQGPPLPETAIAAIAGPITDDPEPDGLASFLEAFTD